MIRNSKGHSTHRNPKTYTPFLRDKDLTKPNNIHVKSHIMIGMLPKLPDPPHLVLEKDLP